MQTMHGVGGRGFAEGGRGWCRGVVAYREKIWRVLEHTKIWRWVLAKWIA